VGVGYAAASFWRVAMTIGRWSSGSDCGSCSWTCWRRWEALFQRLGGALLLAGEAGVGKTRLLQAIAGVAMASTMPLMAL
jgi:hypothetical protein